MGITYEVRGCMEESWNNNSTQGVEKKSMIMKQQTTMGAREARRKICIFKDI